MKQPSHVDLVLTCPSCGAGRGCRLKAEKDEGAVSLHTYPEVIGQMAQAALEQILARPCECEETEGDEIPVTFGDDLAKDRVLQ